MCIFELYYLCTGLDVDLSGEKQIYTLFDECYLTNTGIFNGNSNNLTENEYIISNSNIEFNSNSTITNDVISGSTGGTFIFDNTIFIIPATFNAPVFNTYDDLIYKRCYILNKNVYTKLSEFINVSKGLYDKSILNIIFDNCTIKYNKDGLVKTSDNNINLYVNLKITQSKLTLDTLINSNLENSLWLENNTMDTKPIINSGTGKVNLVEIQQKYSDTSENIFPWTVEPTPTVENIVKLIKVNNTEYYVLTENKFTNVKKLDYYFNYSLNYLPKAPYYANSVTFGSLGLMGYTAKKALLNNELCKLKNDTGELIDYVYMILDECTVDTVENTLGEYTTIAMKFLPYFAKLKTDTAVAGQCDVNMCISIILEKTSS